MARLLNDDDRELLALLKRVNEEIPVVATQLMDGTMPIVEIRQYAARLALAADAVLAYAERLERLVIDL